MSSTTTHAESPLMKQYASVKEQYPDALILFRVGDFYETFGEDAVQTSQILGIVLTRKAIGSDTFTELAGFPFHAIDTYLPKLVKSGHRVAICEQLEDPKTAKKLVKRGVTELVTPGVSYNDTLLENRSNNFLAGIHFGDKQLGISFLDISTGEFLVAQGTMEYIEKLLQSFKPSEIVIDKNQRRQFEDRFNDTFYINTLPDWVFTRQHATELLHKHFNVVNLKGYGIDDLSEGIVAAGAALQYLADTAHDKTTHISAISRITEDNYVWLDKFTIRNLELIHSNNENAVTLLEVLDHTVSPMGARLLKRWIVLPLRDITLINQRLDCVEYLLHHKELLKTLQQHISTIGDLERLISKVATGRISPRETVQIKKALFQIETIKEQCCNTQNPSIEAIIEHLDICKTIRDKIHHTLCDDAPLAIGKGQVVQKGIHAELDDLRQLAYNSKDYLLKMQQRESQNTGIANLKIGFNNVFGYYLEVSNSHKGKVPAEWTRKQTLTNYERYITEELKVYEQKILTAEDQILALETRLFNELIIELSQDITIIQHDAQLIGQLDCLLSFANVAQVNDYVRPALNEDASIDIKGGRHPVIEKRLHSGESYVSNDVYLDDVTQQIMIITGPNMSGKSSLLRQTALITLMAQMGCFVPANKATIGLVDKVFTRVGASDNISSGESTFMVEMNETASILNNVSPKSLILLDEIGRGTSTYDGISIAWAITEYLHEKPNCKPKVMFATHYHELNEMAESLPRIKNYHVSVKEVGNKVIFLRKIEQGGSAHSFGIHVARMSGIPEPVLQRAENVLKWLEQSHHNQPANVEKRKQQDFQLSFIQLEDPILDQIKADILDTDINNLTPVEALMKLHTVRKRLQGNE